MTAGVSAVEAMLDGELARPADPTEAGWLDHWRGEGLGALAPADAALAGGMAALSLPQVFIAGYQAALRKVFPDLPPENWAAFVAAEHADEPGAYPGTRLSRETGGPLIDGFKSWVGQSRHVRRLYVTVRSGGDTVIAQVGRDAPGLTITHRESPRFLAGLSQGFAKFEGVAPARLIEDVAPRDFARAEPEFVMLAAAGFVAAHCPDERRDDAIATALALHAYSAAGGFAPRTLAALDRRLQDAAAALGDAPDIPDWQADRRLIAMYSPRIQKRDGRA